MRESVGIYRDHIYAAEKMADGTGTTKTGIIPEIQVNGAPVDTKQRARTAASLTPPGDEKRSKNSDTDNSGESVPLYNDETSSDESDGSLEIPPAQRIKESNISNDFADSLEFLQDLNTPLTSTQVTEQSESETTGVSQSRAPKRDDGLGGWATH